MSPKYFGPFLILECVGKVAYKLQLPKEAQIHDIFHVSQLKPYFGSVPVTTTFPEWITTDQHSNGLQPAAILDTRMVKVHNVAEVQYLVHWTGQPSHEATWEKAKVFVQKFPSFPIPQKT